MIQPEDLEDTSGQTFLVLMIHDAKLGDMKDALSAIRALDCVRGEPSWMRVETLQS
jgi:homoserine dehydrogenase